MFTLPRTLPALALALSAATAQAAASAPSQPAATAPNTTAALAAAPAPAVPQGDPFTGLAECVAKSALNGFKMPDINDPAVSVTEVPSDGIEQEMPYSPEDPLLPATIQGLWWMDGNPLALLVNLSHSTWDPLTRTATLRMYEPGAYSFPALPWEDCSFKGIVKQKVRFEIKFNETYDFATLTNETTGPDGKTVISKGEIYTMQLMEDGHWVRRSWFNGVRYDYQLRRIVNSDGKRDPAYADYLNVATATSAISKAAQP